MERDYAAGRVLRDAHPKMHACVRGEFTIEPILPDDLRVGLFAQPRTYPAWIRFSNASCTVAPDSKGDIRGVAIKLMDVPGPKLQVERPDEATHDFTLISEDRFVTKDVAQFDGLVAALPGGPLKVVWFFLCHPRAARNLWVFKRCSQPPATHGPYAWGSNAVGHRNTPRYQQHTESDTRPDFFEPRWSNVWPRRSRLRFLKLQWIRSRPRRSGRPLGRSAIAISQGRDAHDPVAAVRHASTS
jgi:hypothetical protein